MGRAFDSGPEHDKRSLEFDSQHKMLSDIDILHLNSEQTEEWIQILQQAVQLAEQSLEQHPDSAAISKIQERKVRLQVQLNRFVAHKNTIEKSRK